MSKPTTPIAFPAAVLASARDYVPALTEACGDDVAPVDLLLETAAYPKILRRVEMAEFIVGWFHGVAEAVGGDNVRETYAQLLAAVTTAPATAKRPSAKRERIALVKPPAPAKPATAKRERIAVVKPPAPPAAVKPEISAPALPPAPISKREALAPLYAPPPAAQATPPASPRARRGRPNQPSLGF